MSILIDFKTGATLQQRYLPKVAPVTQVMPFPETPVKEFAPGVTLMEHLFSDEYVGTADALVAAGVIEANRFPGQPGMRKVAVTILPDGTLPTGAPTANDRRAKEPGAKHIRRASKMTFSVCVRVTKQTRDLRWAATDAPRTMPQQTFAISGDRYLGQAHDNVVDLQRARAVRQQVRTAKQIEQRAPVNNSHERMTDTLGEERRLLWVSQAEAQFLSDMYQHGADAAARRLIQRSAKPLSEPAPN